MEKQKVLNSLNEFVNTRPGLDWRDYGDIAAYRADSRKITQQLNDARAMFRFCELFSVEFNPQVFQGAFGGRLSINDNDYQLEYCTGQYYPMEYRAAVCAVLAYAIKLYWRECGYDWQGIKKRAVGQFGKGASSRWFS